MDSIDPRCSKEAEFTGCYRRHCIQEKLRYPSEGMDMEYCFRLCNDNRYILAGLYDGNICLCGCSLSCNASLSDAHGQCGIPCPGSVGDFCGGRNAVQTYKVHTPSVSEKTCQDIDTAVIASRLSSTRTSSLNATRMTATTKPATYNNIAKSKDIIYIISTTSNYAIDSDESTSSSDSTLIVSLVFSFLLVVVVGTLIVISVRKKIKSRSLSSLAKRDLTEGSKNERSSVYADENLRHLPSYQPLNTAPLLPYRPSKVSAPPGCAKAHELPLSSDQRENHPPLSSEDYMGLKGTGDNPKEYHIYCDTDDTIGPFGTAGTTSNLISAPNRSDAVIYSVSNDFLKAAKDDLPDTSEILDGDGIDGEALEGDASQKKGNVDDEPEASPAEEDGDGQPTYGTNLPLFRISSGSSVSHDYETEIPFMGAAPVED